MSTCPQPALDPAVQGPAVPAGAGSTVAADGAVAARPAGPGERPGGAVRDAVSCLSVPGAPRGDGRTLTNWRILARTGATDLDTARLVEAHLDAATITSELDGADVAPGSLWGVWAAESATAGVVRADVVDHGGWTLSGSKPWCSGTAVCTHALVTAHAEDGRRLFAVDLTDPGIRTRGGEWVGVGMVRSSASTVDFDRVAAVPVGAPGAYLDRAGFWHGAIAVAAAWFGGAVAVAEPLRRAGRQDRLDGHGRAHLGAVDAALAAARALLRDAADAIDDPPARGWSVAAAQRRALQTRAVVETAVDTAVRHTGRGTGPGPLAHDRAHARRVADLQLYVRQSHAERDLATLGELALDDDTVL